MPKFTKQQLEEQYNKLPPVLKDALFSAEIANKMFEIGKRNSLTIEEIGLVAEKTGHVILGLARPENFRHELEESLNIDEEDAQKIAREVNKEIFYPLREALKAAHQMEITEPTTTTEPVAAKPVYPPKIETPPMPAMPRPTPPQIQKAPIPASLPPTPQQPPKPMPPLPADLSAKALASAEALAKEGKPPPLPSAPKPPPVSPRAPTTIKPIEPVKPPTPLATKIPPIDLRKVAPPSPRATAGKAERMREAIFAPPVEPEPQKVVEAKGESSPPSPKATAGEANPPEKKTPYKGYDPYREPAE